MLRYGIPEDLVAALRSVSASFRGWGAAAKVTRPLADGERLELRDRGLEVQHRPGHSPSDTLFWDAERRILLCADHLIAHISSNPLLSRPLDGSDERPKALVTYLRSLARTRELPAEIVLPGHGEPITDHVALIDERFELHRRRAEKLRRLIEERPRTAYELAQELWGNIAVTQAFLTLSEVVGHVDLLIDAGLVRETTDGGRRPLRGDRARRARLRSRGERRDGAISAAHRALRQRRRRGGADAQEADADHRQPVRDDGLGPAQEPGRLRAPGPLRGRGGARPRPRTTRPRSATRPATAATTSSSPSAATGR